MKIQYIYPFDLSQTPIDVDLDNDFLKFEVGTKGYTDSFTVMNSVAVSAPELVIEEDERDEDGDDDDDELDNDLNLLHV